MRSLHIDFTNYNGHQMVISGKEAFRRIDLHELELNMLSDNTIRTLLPMSWLEVDDHISFNYQIQGFRLMSHHLRSEQLSMQRYYSLLLSLADGLATCYDYMLRPHCCLIDEQMLYIDESLEKIGIVYLPLQQPHTEQLGQSLLLLAVRWSGLVTDLDAAGYHRILQLLSTEELPINPLRQLLLDLIHEQTQRTSVHTSTEDNAQKRVMLQTTSQTPELEKAQQASPLYNSQSIQGDSLIDAEHPGDHASSKLSAVRSILAGTPKPEFRHVDELEEDDDELDDEQEEQRLTWKHVAIIAVVGAAIGLTWMKLYTGEQSFDQLLLCSGITIGLLALVGLVLLKPVKAWISASKLNEPIAFDLMTEHAVQASARLSPSIPSDTLSSTSLESIPAQRSISPSNMLEAAASKTVSNFNESVRPQSNAKHSLATVKLDELQATAMLNEQPLLVRSLQGEEDRIMIDEGPFLIGRAEEGVHYQEMAKGVSRVHVELEWKLGKLQVKDVGSRNGSYLNGQLMVAYKSYPLHAGDKLQLCSTEGPIYELVKG